MFNEVKEKTAFSCWICYPRLCRCENCNVDGITAYHLPDDKPTASNYTKAEMKEIIDRFYSFIEQRKKAV